MSEPSLFDAAYQALMTDDPDEKVRLSHALRAAWLEGALSLNETAAAQQVPQTCPSASR